MLYVVALEIRPPPPPPPPSVWGVFSRQLRENNYCQFDASCDKFPCIHRPTRLIMTVFERVSFGRGLQSVLQVAALPSCQAVQPLSQVTTSHVDT